MKPESGFLLASRLQEELDRLFERALGGAQGELEGSGGAPRLDVVETAGSVTLVMEAAGLDRAELSVIVERGSVVLSGERSPARPEGDEIRYHCMERPRGPFRRRVQLPCPVNVRQGRARLRNGLLTVELPKIVERRGVAHRIEIEMESDELG